MVVYTSWDWHVTPGREAEFVEAWSKFAQRSRRDVDPTVHATLLRDDSDASHFMSVGSWHDLDMLDHWRQSMGFETDMARLEGMCETMKFMTLKVAAHAGPPVV